MRRMLEDVRAALHQSQRDDPLLPELVGLITALTTAEGLSARLTAWIALQEWTRFGTRTLPAQSAAGGDAALGSTTPSGTELAAADTARLRLLLHTLSVCAPLREEMRTAVGAMFVECDATDLLAETGMPSDRGFLAEGSERLWGKILPEPREPRNLDQFIRRCFRRGSQVTRFASWPPELFHRFSETTLPGPGSPAWSSVSESFENAVRLLCARVAAQGLAPKLRSRSHSGPVSASPFARLPAIAERLLCATPDTMPEITEAWLAAIAGCRAEMAEIHRQIGGEGVSVDIVFGLDVLDRCLSRLDLMGRIVTTPEGLARSALIHRLLASLVHHAHEQRSLRAHTGTNLRLLYRRIVERSSETGEHYIARDRNEYRHLLLAAIGGGVLTVGTAVVKITMSGWHMAEFLHGLAYGFNYAISFLILHHCHLVLATKQPAMTAATLATIMRHSSGSDRIELIVDRIARITHSQLAAAAGNVLAVGAGALAFSNLWQLMFGHTFIEPERAQKMYDSFGPLTSGTVFFAAFTGVILWLSSVIGGWIDNWSAFHRLPQGLADSSWGVRFAEPWRRNVAAWGTNISLGLMLGMIPSVATFFGLPLDVRHVTLSTGSLMMACGSLGAGWWSGGWFLNAAAGIAVMFVLNLGVSFALSLWLALRALEIPQADQNQLLRRLLARLVTNPGAFILPPRSAMKGESL